MKLTKHKIIVTGGLGFIGSHTVVELCNLGFEVVIVDDLSNSSIGVLRGLKNITKYDLVFEKIDLKNKDLVKDLFIKHKDVKGVIHFAASKAVGESVDNPLKYYENNLNSLINILDEIKNLKNSISFIFSSSCTVYGQAINLPITEQEPIKKAESPYGNTKQICEEIIKDFSNSFDYIKAISLRYFNPIGAHSSIEIGELPIGRPQNLVPFITQTAIGKFKELIVHGDNYPTSDGTCVRDYIHVVDLAKAHIKSLTKLIENKNSSNYDVFNLGTGKGSSVLDVINSFERVSGQKLNYKIGPRRKGDITKAFASTKKANTILKWKTELSLDQAILSAWKWQQKIQ
jgi:UDP-glucose 4-epimerase